MVRPAHCTALGKIILASLRPDQLKRFLDRVEMKPSTDKSITDVAVLLREIAEIKRTGIAFDDGEFNPEVRCVAVPVTDFTGQVIGALGISGPIWRLSNQALHNSAQDRRGRGRSTVAGIRRQQHGEFFLRTRRDAAFDVDSGDRVRKYHPTIEKRLSHSRISRNCKGDIGKRPLGGDQR